MTGVNGTALPAQPPAHWGYVALVPGTKRPAAPRWQDTPMRRDDTDPFARGIHLGASGLIEVDDDGGLDAFLKSTGHVLPETYTVRTASGRLKRFYAAPRGTDLQHASRAIPGVELRCGNHQAVAPGSVVDGVAYFLADGRPPVAPPEWVVIAMSSAGPRQAQEAAARRVPFSVAVREFEKAMHGLANDVRAWAATGWGPEAHAGLLSVTMHLARLNHAQAEAAFRWAFAKAGQTPDDADLAKLYSAIERAVPDIVIPDDQLTEQERFFLGGDSPLGVGLINGADAWSSPAISVLGANATPTPGVEGRRRFQPMSRAEASCIVPPASLVDGLLLSNTKARLSAPPGAGKTWVVLDLAAHIAAGMPWQGRAVAQTRVLYVAGEGAPSFDQRIQAWEQKYGVAADVDIIPDAPQIATEDWVFFCEEIKDAGYGLIIFDTQSSITVGLEENSNKDAGVALSRLDVVRKITGACLLLVHHTGHEEAGRGRGASAWLGGLDTELILSGTLGDLQLKTPKQKYIESGKAIRLRLEKCGPGMVLTPPAAPVQSADAFFGDVLGSEHTAKIEALTGRIRAYYAAGGTAKPSVRSLTQVLRVELGVQGRTEDFREAIRAHLVTLGMPVEQASDLRAHSA